MNSLINMPSVNWVTIVFVMLAVLHVLFKFIFHAKSQGGEVLILPICSLGLLFMGALYAGELYGLFWGLALLCELGAWNHSKLRRLNSWACSNEKLVASLMGLLLLACALILFVSHALSAGFCVGIGLCGSLVMCLVFTSGRGTLKPTDLAPPAPTGMAL